MEALSHHRYARNRRPLAPDWFLYVLAADFQSPEVGRKEGTPKEVRELIFRMVVENPTWGAPRIHGELRVLGFELSERTISRWMKRAPRDPERGRRWLAFIRNHREAIAAMDFLKRTSFRSPWQNGIAERWVGSCRRDLLDQLIALNERHLKRLLSEYVRMFFTIMRTVRISDLRRGHLTAEFEP